MLFTLCISQGACECIRRLFTVVATTSWQTTVRRQWDVSSLDYLTWRYGKLTSLIPTHVLVCVWQRCVTSVDTSSVSSRAAGCGLERRSEDRLKAEFGDRFNWVSHFSVVIGPVTPTNYSTVTYYTPSSVSNSSTVTNCLQNYNFIQRRGKCATSKSARPWPCPYVKRSRNL